MKEELKKNWIKKVKCGICKKKIPKRLTKLTKEGKRVCENCFEDNLKEENKSEKGN